MSKTATQTPDPDPEDNKPVILKAIEMIVADPAKIKKEALALLTKYQKRYKDDRTHDDIRELSANKVIQNYSYMTAFSGGITALAGVIPGLGTVVAAFGGATADIALCMKFQIEMVMALATIYDHDIETEDGRNLCFVIAGLGAINKAGQQGAKELGTQAFTKMAKQYLKGPSLLAVKAVFKKVGITFTRKSLEKAIPFGVGTFISFTVNKTLTWYVGKTSRDFFQTN